MYLDLVMLLNFAVDYLLLFATARLSGLEPRQKRLLSAAVLGAVYSGGCLVPGFEFLGEIFWRVLFLALLGMLAFGWRESSWRQTGVFLLLSLSLGGMAELAGHAGPGMLLLCAGLLWLVCTLLLRGSLSARRLVSLDIMENGVTLHLTALRDTGNTLRDPITGEQVLVIGQEDCQRITGLTRQELEAPLDTLTKPPIGGLRLIPYRNVGAQAGMLLGMRIQEVFLGGRRQPSIVAFAPGRVGGADYQALAGGSL